jgi:hypothetical protein
MADIKTIKISEINKTSEVSAENTYCLVTTKG